jgi:probable HAF family extracellular repeat protein
VARVGVLQVMAATALVVALPAAEAATVTDLGPGRAEVINDRGQVAGESDLGLGFVWTPGRGRQDIGSLGGGSTSVRAINEKGQVAGYARTAGGAWHAFRWTPAAGTQDLGTLGGDNSFATAMSSSGEVVGTSSLASGEGRAFVWSPSSGMQDLGLPNARADDINDREQVVGSFIPELGHPSVAHLFLWSRSTGLRDLGNPDVPVEGHLSISGLINERGQIAGTYNNMLDTYGAYRWTSSTGFELVADLPGNYHGQVQSLSAKGMIAGVYAEGNDIRAFRWSPQSGLQDLGLTSHDWHEHGIWNVNARGEVSGAVYLEDPRRIHAVLWTPSSGMVELPGLGDDNSDATAINSHSQVAGWSTTSSGVMHATLWSR